MKFMKNDALTDGPLDGATIERTEETGEGNLFFFRLTTDQVLNGRSWYSRRWRYENEQETREALDLIFKDYFSRSEPWIFAPIREMLLERGD